MTAREIIKIIKNDGWYYSYSNGGHDYYKHQFKTWQDFYSSTQIGV